MSDYSERTTARRPVHILPLALRAQAFHDLARAVHPFGYCARVLPWTGLSVGDRVLAFLDIPAAQTPPMLLRVAGVFTSEQYPGVKLGSVVAVLEVQP